MQQTYLRFHSLLLNWQLLFSIHFNFFDLHNIKTTVFWFKIVLHPSTKLNQIFLLYINDLPKSVSDKSNPILFADDTSFIITNYNKAEFKHNVDDIFSDIYKWFQSNLLYLNYDKTYLMQFLTKTNQEIGMEISFNNKKITTTPSIKFLGLSIDASLTWKYHINELTSRLNKACYAIRSIRPFMSLDVLRSTYFSYVHSILLRNIILREFILQLRHF
jgi:hypothetical protein